MVQYHQIFGNSNRNSIEIELDEVPYTNQNKSYMNINNESTSNTNPLLNKSTLLSLNNNQGQYSILKSIVMLQQSQLLERIQDKLWNH